MARQATHLLEGVTTEEVHPALGLDLPQSGSEGKLTAKAWNNAVGMAYPSTKQHTLTP